MGYNTRYALKAEYFSPATPEEVVAALVVSDPEEAEGVPSC